MNKVSPVIPIGPFQLNRVVVKGIHGPYSHPHRPTVMVLVQTPLSELIMVLPRSAELQGWIFPQGEIEPNETPLQAALREVNEECGYQAHLFDPDKAVALHRAVVPRRLEASERDKEFFVVGLQLTSRQWPRLNGENLKSLFVHSPNDLWARIYGCRQPKQALITACLRAATKEDDDGRRCFLQGKRWTHEHLEPLLTHAGK